jgi:hypothetical protein
VPHVILKHDTPEQLLDRIVQVFNKTFTTTTATTSYLGGLLKSRDTLRKFCVEDDRKGQKQPKSCLIDPKTGDFTRKLTKNVVTGALKTDIGSASRYITS